MTRLLSILALLLFSGEAAAQTGVWGFTVFDQSGEFVTAKWPNEEELMVGGSRDADLTLDGLKPLHAYFALRGSDFLVRPMHGAEVLLDGVRLTGDTLFDSNSRITLGRYEMRFYLASDPPPKGVAEPGAPPKPAGDGRKTEFEKRGYAFCHDEDFGQHGTTGVDFCTIFDESTDEVCPKARESCPNWQPYQGTPFRIGRGRDGQGHGDGSGEKGKGGAGRRIRRRRVVLPIPKEVGIVLLVVVGGALLFWFLKSLRNAGWEGEELDLETEELSDAARNLQALPDARSNVLVKLAERALGRGDPEEAAILLHLAVLRYLDDEGLARYHPSRTNGDYLRAIRRHKELRELLRGIANETERVRFGDGHVDEAKVQALLEAGGRLLVQRRSSDPLGAAPGAALLLLIGALAPVLTACPSGEEEDALPAFYAHGPTGMSALVPVLRASGLSVSVDQGRLLEVAPEVGVVVIRTSAASKTGWPKGMRLDELLDRNVSVVVIDDRGKSPFFLPTTDDIPAKVEAVPLEVTRPGPDSFCSWKLSGLRSRFAGDAAPVLPRGRRIVWDGISTSAAVSAHELRLHPAIIYEGEPEIPVEGAAAVAFAADRVDQEATLSGCLYVFSDRDLFTNASLTRESNARFVEGFFRAILPAGQRIQIMDRLDAWSTAAPGESGGGGGRNQDKPSPAETLKSSNMLPFVLQALAMIVLLFIFVGAAFGPLRDPAKREHKAFVEHVEAIGRQYARTGQPGLTHAAQSLAKLLVMRHRDRVRGGPSGGWTALSRHLAEKHQLPESDVQAALRLGMDSVNELGAPRIDDPSPSSTRMLETLSRLLRSRSKEVTEKPRRRRFRIRRSRSSQG